MYPTVQFSNCGCLIRLLAEAANCWHLGSCAVFSRNFMADLGADSQSLLEAFSVMLWAYSGYLFADFSRFKMMWMPRKVSRLWSQPTIVVLRC